MKLVIRLLTLLFFIILAVSRTESQDSKPRNIRSQKAFEQGKNYYDMRIFGMAIESLKEALSYDPNYVDAYLLLAQSYYEVDSVEQQLWAINKVLQLNPEIFPPIYIARAEAYHLLGQYENAYRDIEYFKKRYLDLYNKNEKYIDRVESKVGFSLNAVKNPLDVQIRPLPPQINTFRDEYWPSFTVDNSWFLFTRQTRINKDRFREDLWICQVNGGIFGTPQPLDDINSNDNEGASFMSPDGRYILFTGCNRPDGLGSCDIYLTVNKDGKWATPKRLGPTVNSKHWESRPVISADGKTLYFASNRPGGYGRIDLYKSSLLGYDSDGFPIWGPAENLGPEINTEGNEMAPFIHPDNITLYFSSNYHPGLGRYDIFKSVFKNGKWSKPVNLEYPINTEKDEIGIFVQSDGKTAYISKKTGNPIRWDIFYFELPAPLQAKKVTYAKGQVEDKVTHAPISATIEMFDVDKPEDFIVVNSNNYGEFLVSMVSGKRYGMNVDREGYLFYSNHFEIDTLNPESYNLLIQLEPIKEGAVLVLNNVFFDFDSYNLTAESKKELAKLVTFLKQNPSVKIEIGGHTDNMGETSYNKNLSENRAKSVYNYLIQNGIDRYRLTFKGYGASQPVADNNSEDGRALNRRTEIKILSK